MGPGFLWGSLLGLGLEFCQEGSSQVQGYRFECATQLQRVIPHFSN